MSAPEPSPIDAIADAYVADYAALDPLAATQMGIAGHEDELTDLSVDGFNARADLTRRALAEAQAVTTNTRAEAAAREAFVERLSIDVERHDAGLVDGWVSVIGSGAHDLRGAFDLMSIETDDDWAAIQTRLRGVPATLDDYRRTLSHEAAHGRVCAARQYSEVSRQIAGWVDEGGAFAELLGSADTSGHATPGLGEAAAAANRALADFGVFLRTDLLPTGREADAVGEEAYQLGSRYFLGAKIDLDETYAWGWEELHRIETEMLIIADGFVPGGTIEEAAHHLDNDPARFITDKGEFRDWMQRLADTTLSDMADVHFDIPEPVRRIECRIAPTEDGGVYYTGPSEDFSRPGRMWWSVPADTERFSPWREVTTVYHEGVPGHHLQVGQTIYRAESLNRWQRLMCWVSGSGEGWALYAERLMDELGYLTDPADRLGMLDGQAMRAARVVVDIGVHLGLKVPANPWGWRTGETWTPAMVADFMRAHSRISEGDLRFEVNRYLGWPGQAPSYKVGERLWLQLRADVKARRGADFDLKTFHRDVLDLGSIGLDPLTRAVAKL